MRLPVWIIGSLVIALAVACSGEFGTQLPKTSLMFDEEFNAAFERVDEVNRTTDFSEVNHEKYPVTLGIDARNSKIVLEQYYCWENCPETGAVFLVYGAVESENDCQAVGGNILNSTVSGSPASGSNSNEYVACQPRLG